MNWMSLLRWRWWQNPSARERLIRSVQMSGLTQDQQQELEDLVLDEDRRVFDLMRRYELMGHSFKYKVEDV
jgi:hypothetical protein